MGLGRGSDDFNKVGPTHPKHYTDVDWTKPDHKRIVAACLVMGVYVLERDRQEKGEGPVQLAEPWFSSFNFKLDRKLIHIKDESIYGAIYKFESPSDHLPPEAPKYAIAFRGTVLKEETALEDLELDYHIFHQGFHKRKRTKSATEEVERVVFPTDNPGPMLNVYWLVGHSLGSALAIQAGKNVVKKKNAILPTFLFNPPYPSLVSDIIGQEEAKEWFEKKKRKFKTKLANRVKDPDQVQKDEADFAKLSSWSPHLFVNRKDWICSGYIGYFERRKRLKEIDPDEWMLDTMYSTCALLKDVLKSKIKTKFFSALKKVKVNKKKSDYDSFYLLPSAILSINDGCDVDEGRVKHGIRQWWTEDLLLDETLYLCDHCKP